MLGFTAKDIMTRDVATVRRSSSIEEALRLMSERHVSGLPVVDANGCVEGIITESDVLLKGQGRVQTTTNKLAGHRSAVPDDVVEDFYRKAQGDLVEDAMTTDVVTFSEDSAVTDIARVMVEQNINRIPIVSGCRVVGIISRRDIVRAMANAVNGVVKPTREAKREVIDLS